MTHRSFNDRHFNQVKAIDLRLTRSYKGQDALIVNKFFWWLIISVQSPIKETIICEFFYLIIPYLRELNKECNSIRFRCPLALPMRLQLDHVGAWKWESEALHKNIMRRLAWRMRVWVELRVSECDLNKYLFHFQQQEKLCKKILPRKNARERKRRKDKSRVYQNYIAECRFHSLGFFNLALSSPLRFDILLVFVAEKICSFCEEKNPTIEIMTMNRRREILKS